MAKKPLFKIDPGSEVTASGTGYIFVTCTPDHPGKKMPDHDKTYVYKHVVVMENHLGKLIDTNKFEVHHKDEDPKNNKLSNLELKTRGEHSRGHALKNKFWKKSPRTKPGKKRKAMALQIVSRYLSAGTKVFLDDLRSAPAGWTRTYWPEEAIDLLKTGKVTDLSLDHDLGNDDRGTGYDVLKWLEEAVAEKGFRPIPEITIHSANGPARARMEAAIKSIQRFKDKN